jgi:murein DD-endopeptidase MepM/ murein hydrolase activator NlpD
VSWTLYDYTIHFLKICMRKKSTHQHKIFFVRFFASFLSTLFLSCCTFQGTERVVHVHEGEIAIKKGDTIASLCMEHNVNLKEMVEYNNLQPPYSLKGVDKLALPLKEAVGQTPKVGPRIDPDGAWTSDNDQDEEKKPEQNLWGEGAVMTENVEKMTKNASATPEKKGESGGKTDSLSFVYPVKTAVTKSLKGDDNSTLCFRTSSGTPVGACARGKVYFAGDMEEDSSGKIVIIEHDSQLMSIYRCLKNISVKKGDTVRKGQGIAQAKGSVFKFELRKDRKTVNPRPYLEN